MRRMKHVEAYLDEYLRGELGRRQTEMVAAHLARCPRCAARADWLEQLADLAERARTDPPAEVVTALEERLLALPGELAAGDVSPVASARRIERTIPFTARFPLLSTPAVRVAAALLLGVAVGYGLWGRPGEITRGPESVSEFAGAPSPGTAPDLSARSGAGIMPAAATTALSGGGISEDLEARIARLERLLLRDHLGRVEATVTHFVTGASTGEIVHLPEGSTRELLSTTASLKFDYREAGDARMAQLLGQIESVLTEIDRICCSGDLASAVTVASQLEEVDFLPTLQRAKVAIEE